MNRSASTADAPAALVGPAEANALFADLAAAKALVLAVSGGPDSTALLALVARWRAARRTGPELLAVTVDHRLRPESAREARAVKRMAGRLGVRHRTLRWSGEKPATGLQEAAREMRYRLLGAAARGVGALHVVTAHTLDDQAETVLLRMARGSGPSGLCGMARLVERNGLVLVRPFLDVPKARLIATLNALGMKAADDPTNRDPRFTRARLRKLMPVLAAEGLDASRLALLARRLRRAEAAIEVAVDAAVQAVSIRWDASGPILLDAEEFARLPAEVALRLLGRGVAAAGEAGAVQLAKLEALASALSTGLDAPEPARVRRTLAGALVTLAGERLTIERAPPRSHRNSSRSTRLTTHKVGGQGDTKRR